MAIYREKYSKSSALLRRPDLLRRQKGLDLGPGRTAGRAAEPRAFDPGHRRSETHRLDHAAALGNPERKAAVKRIAGAERIDRFDLEDRQLVDCPAVEKNDVVRPVADRKERCRLRRDPLEPFGEIGN